MRLARVLGAVGRALITAGTLILLFVAYQLWGTGIHEARAQDRLEDSFEERLQDFQTERTEAAAQEDDSPPATFPAPPPPPEGEGAAALRIPDIGVEKIVVEGVSLADLKNGPGHYPETPMPGNEGNAAIAGHRTTYGAPFHRIDELEPGDEIIVTTLQGEFRYHVMPVETGEVAEDGTPIVAGHLIVSPNQVEVLDDFGDNRLTLTACHPKYSARQRIVVVAELVEEPAPAPEVEPGDEPVRVQELDLDGEGASAWPAVWWGLAAAGLWLLAWLVGRRWRKWPSYLIGSPFFFLLLYAFFENFSRLLPANY